MTRCSTASASASASATASSSSGAVGERVVNATAPVPSSSAALRSKKLESTPPENAMIARSMRRTASRSAASLPCTSNIPALKQIGRQIPLTRIGKDGDDRLAGPESARDLQRGVTVGAGRNADQDAFVACQMTRALGRILVTHGDDFVVHIL